MFLYLKRYVMEKMNQRAKVLHTMTWLAPGGGADRNVYLSMKEMRADYELHLVVGHEIHRRDFFELEGITVHVCPYLDRAIHPWRDLLSLIWFVRLIRREQFDIVHTHETKSSLIGRIAAWLARCPRIIYGLHGVVFNDPMSKLKRDFYIYLEKWTVGCAHRIVAVGQDTLDQYRQNKIGSGMPQQVVYSGIDVSRYKRELDNADKRAVRQKLGIAEDAVVVVNIGRFSVAKAQHYTIKAFAKLHAQNPKLCLLLVGEGPEQDACKQLCCDLGVEDNVVFAGFIEDVVPVYLASEIHMLTSLREGLPSVAVEASLARVPTVAFEVDGIHEIVIDDRTGYVVIQGDVDALADGAQKLLDDAEKRKLFGMEAFGWAIEQWDHKVMVRDLNVLYQDMLNGSDKKNKV
jgi:glycosyltransferase involved in cell wall biosynthesis